MCPRLCVAEACNKPPIATIEEAPHPVAAIAEWDFLSTRLRCN
jgi:hypothetical protein